MTGCQQKMAQKTDEAIAQYRMAIMIDPNYALAHNNIGFSLAEKGNFSEAISHYKTAIRLKPDYADASRNLKKALLRQKSK